MFYVGGILIEKRGKFKGGAKRSMIWDLFDL